MQAFKVCVLAVVVSAAGCASAPPLSSNPSDYGPEPNPGEPIVRAYMEGVLKDPSSAQYQVMTLPRQAWDAGTFGWVMCFRINAKNSFGGYNGYRPHHFFIKNGRVLKATHGDGGYGNLLVMSRCNG